MPVVLKSCHLIGILEQVGRADVMVLPDDHAAQAGKVGLDPIGVLAVVAVDDAMVHPVKSCEWIVYRHSTNAVNFLA